MENHETANGDDDFLSNHALISDETEDDELSALLASLGEGTNSAVKIYRQGPGGYRDLTLLTEWLPGDFSEMRLQREFGGGHFRIHVRDGRKILKNIELKVAAPVSSVPAAADALAPIRNELSQLAGIVRDLVQVVARPAAPAVPPAQSRKEFFEEMVLMKSILGGGAPRERDPTEALLKMIEVQKQLGGLLGGGDNEPGANTLILKGLETIATAMQASRAQQTAAAPAMMQPALPGVVGAEQAPPAPQQNEEMEMLKMYLRMLLGDAEQDLDPQGWAIMIAQKVDPATISGMLVPENWFDALAALEPKVTHYREWFSDLRTMVLEILKEQGVPDITGGNNPSGAQNASGGTTNAGTQGNT